MIDLHYGGLAILPVCFWTLEWTRRRPMTVSAFGAAVAARSAPLNSEGSPPPGTDRAHQSSRCKWQTSVPQLLAGIPAPQRKEQQRGASE